MVIIVNANPITRREAFKSNPKKVLLFKNRMCEYCKKDFDIELTGIFYWCGCERDE